jgi:Transposase IS200 like
MSGQAKFSKLYHCVYALHYHLVMVTKYRRKCITAPMLARFREIAEARCEGWGGKLLEVNGEPFREQPQDHHLPADPQGIRRRGEPLLSPTRPLEPVVLRYLVRRRPAVHHQAIHRAAISTRIARFARAAFTTNQTASRFWLEH